MLRPRGVFAWCYRGRRAQEGLKPLCAKKLLAICGRLFFALSLRVGAQEKPPMKLVATTPLPGFTGDFDHFGIDLKGKRLFLAAEDHKTVEVFDLAGKTLHHIT